MQSSHWSRAITTPVLALVLFLEGCGDGDGSTGPEEDPVATVGPSGGIVTSADSKVRLSVPAGALSQPTEITITPATPFLHPRLIPGSEYVFQPNGLQFSVPATLTIQLDSIPAAFADQAAYVWLHRRVGNDFVAVEGEPTPLGSLVVRGEIAGFSNYGGGISQFAADLLLAAQQLDAVLTDAIPANAIVFMESLAALFQSQSDPAFQALVQPFLDLALTTACNAYSSAVGNARDAPVDNWGVLVNLLSPVYSWAAVAIKAGAPGGCPNAPLTLDEIQTLKIEQFVTFYVANLVPANFNQDFDRLTDEVQSILDLRVQIDRMGLSAAEQRLQNEAQFPLMDELRLSAYQVCRSDGTHDYLGRLILVAVAATYTADDILNDLQYCGTELNWQVTSDDQSVSTNGVLGTGPNPGSETVLGTSVGIAKGKIRLSGNLRAFKCPDGSFAQDELIVTLNGMEVHRRSATSGAFFPSPLDLDAETILNDGGIDPTAMATVPLVISRESQDFGCSLYAKSTTAVPLVVLQLTFPPPFLYINDFSSGADTNWSAQKAEQSPNGGRLLGIFGQETVTLTLNDLPTHTTATIEIDFVTIHDWEGSAPPSTGGPDIMTFRLNGQILQRTTFSTKAGGGFNQAYPGSYPAASNPAMTGAASVASLGYPSGTGHTGDATYRLIFTVPHTASSIVFSMEHEADGESWAIDRVKVTIEK
jgi:hypothetical protein